MARFPAADAGKTAFVQRATKDTFDPNVASTIGLDYASFEAVLDAELWRVEIWDTAGQDRFRTIQKAYYRHADGMYGGCVLGRAALTLRRRYHAPF